MTDSINSHLHSTHPSRLRMYTYLIAKELTKAGTVAYFILIILNFIWNGVLAEPLAFNVWLWGMVITGLITASLMPKDTLQTFQGWPLKKRALWSVVVCGIIVVAIYLQISEIGTFAYLISGAAGLILCMAILLTNPSDIRDESDSLNEKKHDN